MMLLYNPELFIEGGGKFVKFLSEYFIYPRETLAKPTTDYQSHGSCTPYVHYILSIYVFNFI